jgi:long-chain acyl-CoA synthetase
MLVNRVMPARHLLTVREMVEGFAPDRLSGIALQSRRPDGWWKLSYGELRDWVRSLGTALLAAGVRPGDRVGVISENRSEWVITYLAATCVGAVIVPFDVLLKAEELAAVMKAAAPVLVFTSTEYLEKVQKAQATATAAARLVLFDAHAIVDAEWAARSPGAAAGGAGPAAAATAEAAKAVPFAGWKALPFTGLVETGRLLRGRGRDLWAGASVKPKDLAALIFTSGTTGVPKGVMLSHGNLVANGDGVQQTTVLGATDNWIIVLPFHHTYPTSMGIFVPLLTHGTITCVPSMKVNVLVGIMKETQPTAVPAIPLLIEKLYKGILANVRAKGPVTRALFAVLFAVSRFLFRSFGIRAGKVLFKSVAAQLGLERLRFFVSGGGPIAKEVIDGMEALGLPTYQGYGLSEHAPVVASCCPPANRPGSVGLPLANAKVRIVDPDANGNGEILVRGPSVMSGYLGMPEKTAEVIDAEGWLHTGDIGMLDADGYLYITGRLKNIIVTNGGKNIYPEEIENLLAASPLLAEVVVIGKRGADGGEEPHAIIHPNGEAVAVMEKERGAAIGDEDLRKIVGAEIRRCTAGVAGYKAPRTFEVSRDELPKTSTSKVKRFLFADRK